ncbi:MAG: M20 family metallopeptidase [Bacillota bacterium]|nr:M20 family metallopeptidase [Bacillota bacterium]
MIKERVARAVDTQVEALKAQSEWMYHNPEIGYQEYESSKRLAAMLESAGFTVDRGVAGMDTAFVATYAGTSSAPVIGLFAEYDALPGIGHACGHNIIGTGAVGAGIALVKAWPDIPATIKVFGSPAEEGGAVDNAGGKVHLVDHGFLQGVDAAMMVHPCTNGNQVAPTYMSRESIEIVFSGKTAQPAGSAHEGINALEAAVMAYIGINSLRQYLKPNLWIHGVITEGGKAPNIIPDRAVMRFYVRGLDENDVAETAERVRNAARSAASTTGATVAFREYSKKYMSLLPNAPLSTAFRANFETLGRRVDTAGIKPRGSSDMGNVTWAVPGIHAEICIGDPEVIGNTHSPRFAAASVSEEGHRALLDSARAMAMTTVDLIQDPGLLEQVKRVFVQAKAAGRK